MFRPPFLLSTAETEAVVLDLKYVTQFGGDVLKVAARDAVAKIASVLLVAARKRCKGPSRWRALGLDRVCRRDRL